MKDLFSEADLARIREAVAGAEQRTSGEIVPYIVSQSDGYDVAVWRGACTSAILVWLVAMLVVQFYQGWGLSWLYTNWSLAVLVLSAGILGALLTAYVSPLKRVLSGGALLDQAVHRRAVMAFVEEEVFSTRERTGILLFISLLEHRIEVLGDTGINRKVTPDEWTDVVRRIRKGIKDGNIADGLVDAIGMCGELLERGGVEIRPDDENELPDDIRIRGDE
ncbi:MAG: TPM domain-containing protein [Rhodothermales bacterium]